MKQLQLYHLLLCYAHSCQNLILESKIYVLLKEISIFNDHNEIFDFHDRKFTSHISVELRVY